MQAECLKDQASFKCEVIPQDNYSVGLDTPTERQVTLTVKVYVHRTGKMLSSVKSTTVGLRPEKIFGCRYVTGGYPMQQSMSFITDGRHCDTSVRLHVFLRNVTIYVSEKSPGHHTGRLRITLVNRTTDDRHYGAVLFTMTSYKRPTQSHSFHNGLSNRRSQMKVKTLGRRRGVGRANSRCFKKSPCPTKHAIDAFIQIARRQTASPVDRVIHSILEAMNSAGLNDGRGIISPFQSVLSQLNRDLG